MKEIPPIYCDNAAAMPPDDTTLAYFSAVARQWPGNQEAAHAGAYLLRRELDDAVAGMTRALTGEPNWRTVWCEGGTGAIALFAADVCDGRTVLTSALEHPALLAGCRRHAASVRFLDVDRRGKFAAFSGSPPEVAALHQVQSELGTAQDLDAVFAAMPPQCVKFADSIQAAGKLPLPRLADVIAISGVKFGAPGGAALLVSPRWTGGDEFIERAGRRRRIDYLTDRIQPALALTLAATARRRAAQSVQVTAAMREFNCRLRSELSQIPGVRATIPEESASPYILHLTLPGKQGAVAVRILSELGLAAAAGSACSAESKDPSAALRAIGFDRIAAFSGLRLSFGFESDTKRLLETLPELLMFMLKKY